VLKCSALGIDCAPCVFRRSGRVLAVEWDAGAGGCLVSPWLDLGEMEVLLTGSSQVSG
jgi:hypothetical protein